VSFGGRLAHVALLVGLCALSVFAALGSTPLWEPDEPRFAGATREMLRSGNYLDPVFNGQPRWEKPILLYWLQAAPLALGFDEELSMRLPAAMLGTAAVICVYALGVFWWSPSAGLIAAALLATTFRFVTYARQGLTDVPAVAGIVATVLAFELGSSSDRSRRAHASWWTGWVIVGLTALTKGPLALIAPAIWIAATWIRRRDALDWIRVASGALLAAVIGGSWFVYMAADRGSAFIGVNNYEFLRRYFDQSFPGPSHGPLYYLAILPGEIAPWTLIVAAGLVYLALTWRSLDRRGQDGVILSTTWFVGVILICSFSHYKLPHYALPAYPPLMLLAGAAIEQACRSDSARQVVTTGVALTAIVFVAAGAATMLAAVKLPEGFRNGAPVLGLALLAGGAAALPVLRRRRGMASLSLLSLATATAVAYGVIAMLFLPTFASAEYPYPTLGRLISENSPPSVAIGSIGAHTALVYYGDRPVRFFESPSEAAQFLNSPEARMVVLSRGEFEAIKQSVAASELASHRRQNPRLSRLLEGRFMTAGTEELLIGNPAAVAGYSGRN
jgi:4-amino-4-deoxy-L-arabinose transferase-like glycosyltransferase